MERNIEIDEVRRILETLLSQYEVQFEMRSVANSAIFEVPLFGVKIIYLDGQHFDRKELDGWHIAWVHPDYSTAKAREAIIWSLVSGGYFHYLRNNYKRTFQSMIHEGWDKKIIDERLRRFRDIPKYNYFRELNMDARKLAGPYVLSVDSGFYDAMDDNG